MNTLFEQSLDYLRDEAVRIAKIENEVNCDVIRSRYRDEWDGLNSWSKGNFFSGDKRFRALRTEKSDTRLHPEAHGRIITVWGLA